MALVDDVISGQLARYPYGPLPVSNQVLELPPAGQPTLEIPQARQPLPAMPPYVLRPAAPRPPGVPSAEQEAAPSGQIINPIMRLLSLPNEAVAWGSRQAGMPEAVTTVLSTLLPLILFGIGSRMALSTAGEEAGAVTGELPKMGEPTGSLMQKTAPLERLGGGGGTSPF